MSTFIAVDVGGTQIRVAVYGNEGIQANNQVRIATSGNGGSAVERLIDLIKSHWPVNDTVTAIGIAAPGPTDPRQGIVLAAPNIPGWINLPLQQIVENKFNVPVFVGNDANLAALGEWQYGAGRGHHNLLYITVSTGIGGGIICADRLVVGENGLAGELGHMTIVSDGPLCGCGHSGHLEALASGTAIAHYVQGEIARGKTSCLSRFPTPTAKEVSQAAQEGDHLAIEALARAGRYLGIGLVNYLHIFNPSIIVLGGGVSQSGSYLFDPMKQAISEMVISPEYLRALTITPAALGDEAGLLGALVWARSAHQEIIQT